MRGFLPKVEDGCTLANKLKGTRNTYATVLLRPIVSLSPNHFTFKIRCLIVIVATTFTYYADHSSVYVLDTESLTQ